MIISIDGVNKIIELDSATESIPTMYSDFSNAHANNLIWQPAFSTLAALPLVPVYATLINGWRIKMQDTGTTYIKVFKDGFIQTEDGSDPFVLNGGVEPRVRYEQPVLAVGYSTQGGITTQDKIDIADAVWQKTLP